MQLIIAAIIIILALWYKSHRDKAVYSTNTPTQTIKTFTPLFNRTMSMRNDNEGKGNFGATRAGHTHMGLDIDATPGETVYAPFTCLVNRWFYVYNGKKEFTGLELIGPENITVKLMYVTAMPGRIKAGKLKPFTVKAGEPVAIMQNRAKGIPAMKNHLHIEVIKDKKHIDPSVYINI
jgi:murein DD-endopeptidase MepM/ murein hydrolase activator NlpD